MPATTLKQLFEYMYFVTCKAKLNYSCSPALHFPVLGIGITTTINTEDAPFLTYVLIKCT